MRVYVLLLAALAACACANDEEYVPSLQGMQGLSIYYDTEENLRVLRNYDGVPGFDFLKIGGGAADVLVSADQLDAFKIILDNNFIDYTVFVEDVYEKVAEEFAAEEIARRAELFRGAPSDRPSFSYYMKHEEINAYLQNVARTYSNRVSLIQLGSSYEGRAMLGLKISSGGKNKPAILIDAGIHAREWIAPATALYILDQVLFNKTNSYLVDKVDWYFVPLLNPDGYMHTHSAVQNRFWRKTRSVNKNSGCRGVDGNRNFDMAWNTVGASSYPCSDTYAGAKPFSEPETQRLRDLVYRENRNKTMKMYITFHSYGQYILYPWGYTKKLPPNEPTLRAVAEAAAKGIASVYGTKYVCGTSSNALYPSAGGSDDWAMGVAGIDLSYTIELPGGRYGFDLPASKILPVGIETFEAIKVFHQYVESKYA